MNSHFGGKVFSGRMFEETKELQLHYNTAVKIEDLRLFPCNSERIFASYFMTL
jgi:hypothetical protein